MSQAIKAFIAGFLATLLFHQGVLAAFYAAGLVGSPAWNMSGVPPFGVPVVISLAFWGGLWGILLWWLIRSAVGAAYWLKALLIGAIGPSAVALLIVFPLKGLPILGGPDGKIIIGALILNAAWGLGVALIMRLLARPSTPTWQ